MKGNHPHLEMISMSDWVIFVDVRETWETGREKGGGERESLKNKMK